MSDPLSQWGLIPSHRQDDFLVAALNLRPPMLLSTWRAISVRTALDPEFVPPGSGAAAIGTMSHPEGAWLTWGPIDATMAESIELVRLNPENLESHLLALASMAFQRIVGVDSPKTEEAIQHSWSELVRIGNVIAPLLEQMRRLGANHYGFFV